MWGLSFQLLKDVGVRGGRKQHAAKPQHCMGTFCNPQHLLLKAEPHTAMSPPQLCTEELGLPNAAVFLSFFFPFSFHLSCLVNTPALVKRSPFRSHLCYFCGLQMQGAACFSSLISVRLAGSRSRIWAWEVGNNELQSLGQCSALEQRGSEVVEKLGRSTESFQMFFCLNIHPPPLFLPLSL